MTLAATVSKPKLDGFAHHRRLLAGQVQHSLTKLSSPSTQHTSIPIPPPEDELHSLDTIPSSGSQFRIATASAGTQKAPSITPQIIKTVVISQYNVSP